MANSSLKKAIDPQYPDYVYASKPIVNIYTNMEGNTVVAKLFIGEWMKVVEVPKSKDKRVYVQYRGGKGYVNLSDISRERYLEIFFIDVDQGDSILIQTPEDRRILIDGGGSDEAYQFIKNKYRLDKPDNYIDFDAIIATHSDSDHTQGLLKILKDPKIAVKRFYHNGLFRRVDKKVDPGSHSKDRVFGLIDRPSLTEVPELTPLMKKIVDAIDKAEKNLPDVIKKMRDNKRRVDVPREGFICKRIDAADRFVPPYDNSKGSLVIRVLWPKASVYNGKLSYPWYNDAGKTVNGNSVVLCVKHGRNNILLTGDLNTQSMEDLIKEYNSGSTKTNPLRANVYKAAHHGSQDFSLPFLKIVKPDAAVISSGDDRNDIHGHPRAILMGTITRYSCCEKPAVFSTELAACYSPLAGEELKAFKEYKKQLYEKSIKGIVHLRSNGDKLYIGTVHGRKAPKDDPLSNTFWKWDIWPD